MKATNVPEFVISAALVGPWIACTTGWAAWVAIHEAVRMVRR